MKQKILLASLFLICGFRAFSQVNCEIYDLVVETGDCTSNSTYVVTINFQVTNPTNTHFDLWANTGQFIGSYALADLPLSLNQFPWDGTNYGRVKVCIHGNSSCCKVREFPVPNCLGGSDDCLISDFVVETGDCTGDSTYSVTIDFEAANPTHTHFDLWTNNNQYIGFYALADLPLTIQNFPWPGGLHGLVKVCINDNANCCFVKEFLVPDCLISSNDCEIWDLNVVTTPCLCSQFFALITFNHENGGNGGFGIGGNGHLYGTYPYSVHQPIIIGPLNGDGQTPYEFIVKDHNHPDCKDVFELGIVECDPNLAVSPTDKLVKISINPNPASEQIQVVFQSPSGNNFGNLLVEIFDNKGQKVLVKTVATTNFSLNIADLPAGNYHLKVLGEDGVGEIRFSKM